VLPDGSIGGIPGEVVMLDLDPPPKIFTPRGTLPEWQRRVAAVCVGNPVLMFGVCCGFAPILLPLVRAEGGGINLRGFSSRGKTTVLDAASSVWGAPSKDGAHPFVGTWRSTANALESTAAAHNHALLPLDEMGMADPREVGETAYMLANGAGKARARAGGGNRPVINWLTLVLSTSEVSLASVAAQAGRPAKAGQEVRLLDVPAELGRYGCFDELHGEEDGDGFATALRAAVVDQHGTAAPAFLTWLVEELRQRPDFAVEVIDKRCRAWVAMHVPPGVDGQVQRAARRLALIAVAGELATVAGVTGWPAGAASAAAAQIFRGWVLERGGTGSREDHHLFAAVRRFIGAHGSSRFEVVRETESKESKPGDSNKIVEPEPPLDARTKTISRAGWRWEENAPLILPGGMPTKVWVHAMLPEVFTEEIAKPLGMELRDALARLGRGGLIRSEPRAKGRNYTIKRRVLGVGRPRLVIFEADPQAADISDEDGIGD
jgi:uncharacterized protein (DUF927 family)